MQAIFTFAIEAFTVTAFAFFSTAFIVGFVQFEREQHHRLIITDTVIPFTRPYRRPTYEPINWQQWGLRDLRKASQRSGFGIPPDYNGKSLTKPQFVTLYRAALEGAAAVDAA